jgi:methylated-DNA-[protein]-cysteine S-methyltransferase
MGCRAGENGVMAELAWAALDTPVGQVSVGCSQAGVTQIRFGSPPDPPAGPAAGPGAGPDLRGEALTQLAEYFSGRRRRFDLPLDWSATSRLQRQVLGVLFDSVGYGETVSYGTLARRVRSAGHGTFLPPRAIGQVMGSNPIPLVVPCHRVVAAGGLGGYSGGTGLEVKRWLLVLEGALPPTLDWEPALGAAGQGSSG